MEESSRESQPRCPCGFWGSAKTLGLCSVCYRKAHRTQSQGNTNIADAGKTAVGTCHSQSQNSNQGKRMDSKHFPSRSTADNLPSSLSSPPGERAALSAAPTSSVDAATPTTSGGATTASHLPAPMSAGGGDGAQTETSTMTLPSCESLLSSDDSDLCSTASSDLSYDPKLDTSCYTSDSCANLVSVASNSAASFTTCENGEECIPKDSQTLGNQSSVIGGTSRADIASNSSTQLSTDSAKTLSPRADAITAVSNVVASSSKNSATKNMENGDKRVDISTSCDINSQTSASKGYPQTNACRSTEQTPTEANISAIPARGTKRSRDEMEASNDECPAPPPQMNKRRCFICSCKLELAQRTIGRCRCDRVFCALHRLPELHECEFNHKEDGRREAREKMVKPTRHLGPSYRREDPS